MGNDIPVGVRPGDCVGVLFLDDVDTCGDCRSPELGDGVEPFLPLFPVATGGATSFTEPPCANRCSISCSC